MGAWEARPIDRLVQIVKPRLSQLRSLDERLGGRLHERRPEQGVHLCAESVPPVLVPPRTRGTVTNTGRQGKGWSPKKNRRQCPASCPGGFSHEPISRANSGSDHCRVRRPCVDILARPNQNQTIVFEQSGGRAVAGRSSSMTGSAAARLEAGWQSCSKPRQDRSLPFWLGFPFF